MRFTVLLGFGVVIVLMVLAGAVGLHQISTANDSVTTLVEVNNAKVELANTMRESIRLRQISMHAMLAMDDPFQLDDELLRFYNHAGPYRVARKLLLDLPTDEREKDIHERLTQQVRIAQPLNQRAAVLLSESRARSEIRSAVDLAHQEQVKLLALLDDLVELQRQYAQEAVTAGQTEFNETLFFVVTFGGIVLLGILGIGILVAREVQRKNEELVQAAAATRSKSAFLANMSHEIRTPLTAIIGFAETSLYSNQSMEDRHRAITTIIRSGKHLLQIINDILDLSKIEANQLEMERVSLSPFHLLTEIDPFVRPKAEEKGIVFGVNYQFPLPEKIKSDPLRLKQILLNLCSNAVKFTDQGHVHINVSVNSIDESMTFEVVDTGIGMNTPQMEKIFEPFKQADSSTTRKYGGTGLGLSLSKQLATGLGGTLTAESEPGFGSHFKLTIATGPIAEVALVYDELHIPVPEQATIEPLPSESLVGTVLLAEDNLDNQQLLSLLLRRLGAEVTLADNGRIAVEKAEAGDFDLILMDMQMPEMDGLQATRLLREHGYDKPVVALTANAMNEDKNRCLDAGCNDFLTKPIEKKQFYEVVVSYLRSRDKDESEVEPIKSALLEDDPEIIEIVHNYIKNLPEVLKHIEEALQQEDWEHLKDLAHQVKGTGGNFGFVELSDIAGVIEFQALNKNVEELAGLFKKLDHVCERVIAGVETSELKDEQPTKLKGI